MKKTIFTFSAIAIVCGAIFFACKKDDNSAIHTTYVSQAGTGTNPDPNHTYTTTTTAGTTGSTTTNTTAPTYSVALTGTATVSGTISGQSCSATSMSGTASNSIGTISLTFSSTIAAGTYNVVNGLPSSGQVAVNISGTYADGGTVTVTIVSGKNVATFNNVTNSTLSTTLTGSMGCL